VSAPAIEPNAERGEVNGADKAAERWIRDSIQPLVDSSVLESDHNRSVYEYWTSQKGSRAFPQWRDLSLMGTSKNAFARSRWHCCCTPASWFSAFALRWAF